MIRLLEEVSAVGIEQVIVVTSDVALARPHALGARLVDLRARLAEYLAGAEASAARDSLTALFDRFSGVFQIQPTHNAVGLFDFSGSYDERSDRRQSIAELTALGYEDAYRQFIEPVVGASGDELERREAARPVPPPSTPSTPSGPSISEILAKEEDRRGDAGHRLFSHRRTQSDTDGDRRPAARRSRAREDAKRRNMSRIRNTGAHVSAPRVSARARPLRGRRRSPSGLVHIAAPTRSCLVICNLWLEEGRNSVPRLTSARCIHYIPDWFSIPASHHVFHIHTHPASDHRRYQPHRSADVADLRDDHVRLRFGRIRCAFQEGQSDKFLYTRYANPTVLSVERTLASIEGAEAALLFSSGMAATTTTPLALTQAGDEVVCSAAIYGGTLHVLADLLARFGVTTRFLGLDDLRTPETAISNRTRLVWFESPINPTLRCVDIAAIARACRARGVLSVIDNTFASPINQQPIAAGVDLVMQSATKYLNGHSDVTAGVIAGPAAFVDRIEKIRRLAGTILDPMPVRARARPQDAAAARGAAERERARRGAVPRRPIHACPRCTIGARETPITPLRWRRCAASAAW